LKFNFLRFLEYQMNNRWAVTSEVVVDEDLHAYIDSELSPGRSAAVARYLSARPEIARRVEEYVAQRDMLHAALAGPANEAVPPQLDLRRLIRERQEQVELATPLARTGVRSCSHH
jgi:anti-sigma factor RsiW